MRSTLERHTNHIKCIVACEIILAYSLSLEKNDKGTKDPLLAGAPQPKNNDSLEGKIIKLINKRDKK